MNSMLLTLLAVAATLAPSKAPDRDSAAPARAAARASVTIVSVARTDCSMAAAETIVSTSSAAPACPRLVRRTGPDGEIRHDLELQ